MRTIILILLFYSTNIVWACDPTTHPGEDNCQPCYRGARILTIVICKYGTCDDESSYELKQPIECVPVCDPEFTLTCPLAEYIRIQEKFKCEDLGDDYFVYDGKCVRKGSIICPPGYSVGQTSDGTEARYDVCVSDIDSGGGGSTTGTSGTGSSGGSGGGGSGGSSNSGSSGSSGSNTDPEKHHTDDDGNEQECITEPFETSGETTESCDCSEALAQCSEWSQCGDGCVVEKTCQQSTSIISCASIIGTVNGEPVKGFSCTTFPGGSTLCSNGQRTVNLPDSGYGTCESIPEDYGCEEGAPSEAPPNPGDPYDEDECLASGCTWVGAAGGWGQCHCFDGDSDGQQDPGDGNTGDGDGGGDGTANCPPGYIAMNGGCLQQHTSENNDIEGDKIGKLDEIARRVSEGNGTLKDIKDILKDFDIKGINERLDSLFDFDAEPKDEPIDYDLTTSPGFIDAKNELLTSIQYIRTSFETIIFPEFHSTGGNCSVSCPLVMFGTRITDLCQDFCIFIISVEILPKIGSLFYFFALIVSFRILFGKR